MKKTMVAIGKQVVFILFCLIVIAPFFLVLVNSFKKRTRLPE